MTNIGACTPFFNKSSNTLNLIELTFVELTNDEHSRTHFQQQICKSKMKSFPCCNDSDELYMTFATLMETVPWICYGCGR